MRETSNWLKKSKGITLIALVVTIIVLLILAGVTISLVMGEGGIIGKAQSAEEKAKITTAQEKLILKIVELNTEAKADLKKLHLKDLIVLNQVKNMEVETINTDENGEEIEETVKIYTEEGKMDYAKAKSDGYTFKINEDLSVEYIGGEIEPPDDEGENEGDGGNSGDNGNSGENGGNEENREDEKDEDYEGAENDDELEDEGIVLDKDIVRDENADKSDVEAVPAGWIGIYTEEDLINMKNDLTGKYILMADLTLKKTWTPLGSSSEEFKGYFNGNGYTISNLKISKTTGYLGMFARTSGEVVISNLTLKNYTITGKGNYIGGLVGYNKGNITNVSCTGNINITGSSSNIGGLVGYHRYYSKTTTAIERVYTGGTISASSYGTYVGGIVGVMTGYSTTYAANTNVSDSYSSMSISGKNYVGGIVGRMYYSRLFNVYSIGKTTGTSAKTAGGVVGYANSASLADNAYWARSVCGQIRSALGTIKTLSELVSKSTYTSWDFTNIWDIQEGTSTAYLRGQEIPNEVTNILKGYEELLGSGTQKDPYQIWTVNQLQGIKDEPSAYYKLMTELDLGEITKWTPIGTKDIPFSGNFDGNGYTISNMKITYGTTADMGDYIGLFGYMDYGTIKNLKLDNYAITGGYGDYIGGLAGYAKGDISNVIAKGNITLSASTVSNYVGGLVGYSKNGADASSYIKQCYTEGNVKSSKASYVGGIVGYTIGTSEYNSYVSNCYTSMNITANRVGGLVGRAHSYTSIRYSYAIGEVNATTTIVGGLVSGAENSASATSSYWIKETTGQSTSALGTNKTISALIKKSSYSGWDFSSIWDIDEGTSLAYLRGMETPDIVYDTVANYPVMDGLGTSSSPYIITNVEQLKRVSADLSAYYKLGNDIDLSSITKWTPIGTEDAPFTGSFDGNGYTISNMKITYGTTADMGDYIGLFGYMDYGTIKNLKLDNYAITGGYGDYIGGLLGYNKGGYISNVSAKGNITLGTSAGSNYIGGLAGYYIYGENTGASISQCYTEGNIKSSKASKVGGIVGYTNGSSTLLAYVKNCYTSMNITANNYVGGLVGYVTGYTRIQYSYAIGEVNATESIVGGLVGNAVSSNSLATYSYWIKETTGQEESDIGTSKTISQLVKKASYSGWDFSNTWQIDEGTSLAYLQGMEKPSIVSELVKDYPIMQGEGTSSSPYIITNAEQLKKVTADISAYYKLGNDIDLSSITKWTPIGTKDVPFTGNFNGDGKTISNMKITYGSTTDMGDYIGLFGYLEDGTIKNLKIDNYKITGGYGSYIGGLVGYVKGTISNVSAKGNITLGSSTSSSYVGGLVGDANHRTEASTVIEKCYTEGNIQASKGSRVGGIVGHINGYSTNYKVKVANCYSTMNITASIYVGGLVGYILDYTTIENSYAIGKIVGTGTYMGGLVGYKYSGSGITVSSSYWDIETTGQESSKGGGTGWPTEKMKTASTYTGWSSSIWSIVDGEYPVLVWIKESQTTQE